MKTRISKAFEKARRENRTALIMYLTAGYPSKTDFPKILTVLAEEGVDLIEIGVPFSDPLADGATIQKASQQALAEGVGLKWIFAEAARFRATFETPLILMTYYNPVSSYGIDALFGEMEKNGLDGVIIPDLPPDEAGAWLKKSRGRTDTIFLIPPTANDERIKLAAGRSGGFVYCVSLAGVTGERKELPKGLKEFVHKVKKASSLPVAVGFGISTPEQAKQLSGFADGVIIGSALISLIERYRGIEMQEKAVREYVRSIRAKLTVNS